MLKEPTSRGSSSARGSTATESRMNSQFQLLGLFDRTSSVARAGPSTTLPPSDYVPRANQISLLILTLVIALPLAGALLAGRQLAEFLAFPPPLDIPSNYLRFSKLAVFAVAGSLVALAVSWLMGRR